jgi:drug/metabolite transporter (DMT)-like permease
LIAFAAKTLGAGVCSILNASSPMFAAMFGALLSRTLPPSRVLAGLAVGLVGVASATGSLASVDSAHALVAALSSLAAAVSYGAAAVYAKRAHVAVTPIDTATGSMIGAALVLAIPAMLAVPSTTFTPNAVLAVVALAVFCTALGYALYFRLLADEGATAALSVTFLVPIFGVLWSALFLDEPITARVLAGGAYGLLGTFVANAPTLRLPLVRAKVMP